MKKTICIFILLALLLVSCGKMQNKQITLNVLCAASLADSIAEIQQLYEKENPLIKLVVSYGASGTLATQIENGAPCDYFISAGSRQMDILKSKGICEEDTVRALLKNELVVIGAAQSEMLISEQGLAQYHKIALGEETTVPAGQYAAQAIKNLQLYQGVKDKLVFAKDVREVLAWVETGSAEAGFVYASDAAISDKVKVIFAVPQSAYSEIIYPSAIIKNSKNLSQAKAFDEFLSKEAVQNIFKKYGFVT